MRNVRSGPSAIKAAACAVTVVVVAVASAEQRAKLSGEEVYLKYCGSCHDQVGARISSREALTKMSPARILRTLDFGLMMSIAYPMRRDERESVAKFLGTGTDEFTPPPGAFCKDRQILSGPQGESWTGWGPSPDNTRFQTGERAGLSRGNISRLQLKWAFGFAGDVIAFAAPTLLNGTLFVGSAGGAVQALDARTGCLHWLYRATGPVRAATTVTTEGERQMLVFSDQNGWVYALDAVTGEPRWNTRVENHEATRLTGSIAIEDRVAFRQPRGRKPARLIQHIHAVRSAAA